MQDTRKKFKKPLFFFIIRAQTQKGSPYYPFSPVCFALFVTLKGKFFLLLMLLRHFAL